MTLRLDKLPDRTPVRMSIAIDPELASALADYSVIYPQTYGAQEKHDALVPPMLQQFPGTDARIKRARRALHARTGD